MSRLKFSRIAIREKISLANAGYLRKWLTVSILVGIVAGVGSIVFYLAIQYCTRIFLGLGAGYFPPVSSGEVSQVVASGPLRVWAIPIITTVGGLISGLIVFKWAPEAEGHGTDAAINAFHNKEGFIRRRVPIIKIIASAITIGSGGSAGREGPVALIGAGFGSFVGDVFKLDSHDRRIALAIGIGAGIGSIFKSPLGGALLSAEILYRGDFEVDALLPSFISSIVGYTIFASWAGWTPIFGLETTLSFQRPQELVGYIILGVACGLFGMLYGRSFYWMRDLFKKFKLPNYFKPALGGLAVGVIAIFLPQVMGMGYGWLQYAINGNYTVLPVLVMLGLIFAKIAATGLSIGSGGSGGVFAPGLFIGGMVGGVLWYLLKPLSLIVPVNPGAFVIVGMMSLFGGIAKAPLAIMVMVSEMTGSYSLLAPCMVTVFVAYFITRGSYIYEYQVNSRADSPAHRHEYSTPLLKKVKVAEAMQSSVVTISSKESLLRLNELMKEKNVDALPVVDNGYLVGIVANLDLVRIPQEKWQQTPINTVMSKKIVVGYPDESLFEAFNRMNENNISHLPIVEKEQPALLAGFLTLSDVSRYYTLPTVKGL